MVRALLDSKLCTEEELIAAGVVTSNILETIKNPERVLFPGDIFRKEEKFIPDSRDAHVDVFFFGIPGSGKTSVLMGLCSSAALRVNLVSGGGYYAAALKEYANMGMTAPCTPNFFVTAIGASISMPGLSESYQPLNFIEMSGTFESMDARAIELLHNHNRKIFFLVIDPTVNEFRINREVIDGHDEETGEPIKHLELCTVNQYTIIRNIVDLLCTPDYRNKMKKVDAIHIIMTKSDTLGNLEERGEKALSLFKQKYAGILNELIDLCRKYNINHDTRFCPKLYTFSLGRFYLDQYFEYDPADSDKLIDTIKRYTPIVKNAFLYKLRNKIRQWLN